MRRISAPPGSPRLRRPWIPPEIGSTFVRRSDKSRWVVGNVFPRDQQVKLLPQGEARPIHVWSADLETLYYETTI